MKHEHHTAEAATPTSVNTEVLSWAEVFHMMPRGLFTLLLIGIVATASLSIVMIVGLVRPTQSPVIWSGAIIALVMLGLTSVGVLQATTHAAWKRFTDELCENCPAIANKITKAEALEAAKQQLRQEEILNEVLMEGSKDLATETSSVQNTEQSETETLTTEVSASEAVAQHEMDNELKIAVNELLDKATNKVTDAIKKHQKHQAQPSNAAETDIDKFTADDELSFEFLADTKELIASGDDYKEEKAEVTKSTKRREVTKADLGAMLDEIERQQNGLIEQPTEEIVSEVETPETISDTVPTTISDSSHESLEIAASSNIFDFFEYAGLSKAVKDFQQSLSDTLGDKAASEVTQAVRSVLHTTCLPKTASATEQTKTPETVTVAKQADTPEIATAEECSKEQVVAITEQIDIPTSQLDIVQSQRTVAMEADDAKFLGTRTIIPEAITATTETKSLIPVAASVIESGENTSEESTSEDLALEAVEDSDDRLSGIPQESMDRIKEIYLLFHKNSGNSQQEAASQSANVAVG